MERGDVYLRKYTSMVIDSHVHFWKFNKANYSWIDNNMKTLQKDYLPSELEPTLRRNNVDGCIAIQSQIEEVKQDFLQNFPILIL